MNVTRIFPRFAFALLCLSVMQFSIPAMAQMMGTAPDSAPNSSTFKYVRQDVESLKTLGGGDMIQGMNKLGDLGYELFIVTTSSEQGAAGWHFFRLSPWNLPINRPKFEYKQMDDAAITDLGLNSYDEGLAKLEKEGWQLVAITTMKNGGVGWYYFLREKPAANANAAPPAPAAPAVQNPFAAPTAADFSTPRAAVQTLITAATTKNVDLLSQCFAETASEEFKPFRTKSASADDLNEIAELFKGATVAAEETQGGSATVNVKLQTREEEIELSKSAEGWKVVDF